MPKPTKTIDEDVALKAIVEGTAAGTGEAFFSALWIPGGLETLRRDGQQLTTEATLSKSALGKQKFYTLILRDVNDRLEAERAIAVLTGEKERLEQELCTLLDHHDIIGRSKVMRKALNAVEQVSNTDASVLLLGETGTGKELFAQAIHDASPRKKNALIKVNCAAIPANLIESEFFGHEKGAFTGATSRREGRFAAADGGTIFLDEVGELPIDLQSKILRVLQEGEFEPVGSGKIQSVDVRVIAATNRDLESEVAEGNFREDLYFRLNVFPINIPPLRERGTDIKLLSEFCLKRLCQKMGRPVPELSETTLTQLSHYPWPGNVRELQNILERAVIMSPPGQLHLGTAFLPTNSAQPTGAGNAPTPAAETSILSMEELQNLERANMIRALERCSWKISGEQGAAALLGLKPSTLTSRMKALRITRPS